MEKNLKKKYIYVLLNQFAVCVNVKQHCKSTRLLLKKNDRN